jgi:nucleoside-diphosphate-sugar epimerase
MLARAAAELRDGRRIFAVSRWSDDAARSSLAAAGVEVISCDLLERAAVARLPDAPNVIFMAGQKFGTEDQPSRTWAMNVIVPVHAAERYAGARIVVFSTGNVYPLVPVTSGGSRETDKPEPLGEYASSCLGRERVFEFAAATAGTRLAIYRLNYAIDVRYGVLLDIARRIAARQPLSLEMGYVNIIWQGDANRIAIEALAHTSNPPFVVNVTGAEILSVRDLAARIGSKLGIAPLLEGTERPDALLSDASRMLATFAPPQVSVDQMIDLVAAAVTSGQPTLDKPTGFQTRDGRF